MYPEFHTLFVGSTLQRVALREPCEDHQLKVELVGWISSHGRTYS